MKIASYYNINSMFIITNLKVIYLTFYLEKGTKTDMLFKNMQIDKYMDLKYININIYNYLFLKTNLFMKFISFGL